MSNNRDDELKAGEIFRKFLKDGDKYEAVLNPNTDSHIDVFLKPH